MLTFRKRYQLLEFRVSEKITQSITSVLGSDLTITLSPPTKEQLKQGITNDTTICWCKVDEKVNENHINYLIELSKTKKLPLFRDMPEGVQSRIAAIEDNISKTLRRFVEITKWRYDLTGKPNFVAGTLEWLNGDEWKTIPPNLKVSIQVLTYQYRNHDENIGFVNSEVEPPLYHELFLESMEIANNTRSSLITAISSAEIAVKSLVIHLTTNAEWLIENLQSPDIVKIIKDYLPKHEIIIDNVIIDELRKAVHLRNQLVHQGKKQIDRQRLDEFHEIIRNLLYLIDFHKGHDWALEHVDETYIFPKQ